MVTMLVFKDRCSTITCVWGGVGGVGGFKSIESLRILDYQYTASNYSSQIFLPDLVENNDFIADSFSKNIASFRLVTLHYTFMNIAAYIT